MILPTWKRAAPGNANAQRLCSGVERAGIRSSGLSGGSGLASYVTGSRCPRPAACGFSCLPNEEQETSLVTSQGWSLLVMFPAHSVQAHGDALDMTGQGRIMIKLILIFVANTGWGKGRSTGVRMEK